MLAKKAPQLERMLNTFGWRCSRTTGVSVQRVASALGKPLLYRYGRFKHQVLLPAFAAVQAAKACVRSTGTGILPTKSGRPPATGSAVSRAEPRGGSRGSRAAPPSRSSRPLQHPPDASSRRPSARCARRSTPSGNSASTTTRRQVRTCFHSRASRREDPRVRVSRGTKKDGISSAPQRGARQARGSTSRSSTHDDALTPDALSRWLSPSRNRRGHPLFRRGQARPFRRRFDPSSSPNWSPELMLRHCIRATSRLQAGPRRDGRRLTAGVRGPSQDYDYGSAWFERTDRRQRAARALPLAPRSGPLHRHLEQVLRARAIPPRIGEALVRRGIEGAVEDGPCRPRSASSGRSAKSRSSRSLSRRATGSTCSPAPSRGSRSTPTTATSKSSSSTTAASRR